ncbi:sodium/glutamate symport carrier protein [Helicobacter muridarum]|uniref:Sodium/glutamate symporter n=2 Tax=Helicobacter muridarum TaxID=216 RepID=A0A377PWJ4_9HELI|nr:sodium/glutamate symport carrier protein [Helicobacter muridarum]
MNNSPNIYVAMYIRVLILFFISTHLLYADTNANKNEINIECSSSSQIAPNPISSWANQYIITHDTNLHTAPSKSCQSNTTIAEGQKITAIAHHGEFLQIEIKQKDKTTISGYINADDARLQTLSFDFYFTLVCMVLVLLIGRYVISKLKVLQDYNIPEPVVGGIIVAVIIFVCYQYLHIEFRFDSSLKDPLMLAFFSSIGLSADFASLKKGGKMLGIFLIFVAILLLLQNIIGLGVSYAMGQNPLLGMLGGSITMSGGHGTGAAWAGVFKDPPYNFAAATEVAMACATFGLVMGGLIGGPTARYLIKKYNLKIPGIKQDYNSKHGFETPNKERLITPISFVESLALIALCLLIGTLLSSYNKSFFPSFNLPTFVYCLFTGVVLRNALSAFNIHKVFDREVSVIGNVSLSLFLAFAMMTLNLWQLVALALPMTLILIAQAICMITFAIFVTFRFCGRDYDAAVLAAGHCGFGLGATPTAMVNMQTVTSHYGPSHMAFIIVPLVGAFFIDIINAILIQSVLKLLPF